MPGSRKLSKVGAGGGGGGGGGGVHLQTRVGPDSRDFFFLTGGGGGGGGFEDFQNERKNALERHIAR